MNRLDYWLYIGIVIVNSIAYHQDKIDSTLLLLVVIACGFITVIGLLGDLLKKIKE